MLSDNIKKRRIAKGLSQEELARQLAVVRQTVSKWEKGLSQPDADRLVSLSQVLEVSVSDLVGEGETPIPDPPAEREHKGAKPIHTVLIILGFPVWFALLIAAAAVVFALCVCLWAVVVSLWAVFAAFAVAAPGCLLAGLAFAVTGYGPTALAAVAAGLVCAGLSILLFFGCRALTKGAGWLTRRMALATKNVLAKKEATT